MALPADFSNIFGSTATGGLTPISGVNYAKGWEYVGSNPPTKNDFSYLQNMSDLKSQWLYNYLTTASNAASRVVGSTLNSTQVPDMSSFTRNLTAGTSFRLPNGLLIQVGVVTTSAAGPVTFTLQTTYPNSYNVYVSSQETGVVTSVAAAVLNTSSFSVAFRSAGTLAASNVAFITVGY